MPGDYVEIQTDNLKSYAAALSSISKHESRRFVALKVAQKFFGPFQNFYYKIRGSFRIFTKLLGINTKAQGAATKQTTLLGKATNLLLLPMRLLRLNSLMMIGTILSVVAVFGYLMGSFGSTTSKSGELLASFNTIKDSILSIASVIMDLDWSPITDLLMTAFGLIGKFIGDFLIAAIAMFAELFVIFSELITYLADVGVFQQIIDIVGILGTAVIFTISSIFIALDQLGINWGSIFGFITDLVAGLANFLMDSGIIPFFVDLIQYLAILLSTFGFVIGAVIILWADMAAYIVGPLWTIFTTVIGGIVDLITIATGIILGVVSIVFKLMSLPARMFFGLMTGGWDGMWEQADKVLKEILGIVIQTFKMIGGRIKDMFDGTVKIVVAMIMLLAAPFLYINDKIEQIFGVNLLGMLGDSLSFMFDWVDGIVDYFQAGFDKLMKPIEDMMEKLEELRDIDIGGGVGDKISGGASKIGGFFGFSKGGIARGPTSGYPATLHGTEAVVPLPDGRTIPVAIQGGMSGSSHTENVSFTINVSGGGDSAKIAKAVSQEVQRAFRTRSRSGGYGRGL